MEERERSVEIEGDHAVSTLYRSPNVDLTVLRKLAKASKGPVGAPFNRGLTSVIYRIFLESSTKETEVGGEVQRAAFCLKRVCIEDEVRPHSVQREIQCYRQLQEARSDDVEGPIMSLLAAFRDESDPFSVEVDLIMPLLTATLEELLDEPDMQFGIRADTPQLGLRPSRLVANAVHTHSTLDAFIGSTVHDLFSALTFLHSLQIAHRDVKPSNILIDIATLRLKLIDFGTCYLPSYTPGDDGKGGVTCEVGTGPYRAPESLFSPMKGHDVSKVDIWQAGVTLIQFFLPLKEVVKVETRRESDFKDNSDEYDQREDWEKALWADDDGVAWSQLGAKIQPAIRDETEKFVDEADEESMSGWKRETLFDATKGDIGLASSQFDLRGLPTSLAEWPEAEHFQPTLQRMPFHPRNASSGGLRDRLVDNIPSRLDEVIEVIDHCIQLSASSRISAEAALKQIQHLNQA